MILDILNAERDGEIITVTFVAATLPRKQITRATRRLKHLYNLAHDSEDTACGTPVMIINGTSFPMQKHNLSSQWSLQVPPNATLSIIYGGNTYDLGNI